jgi:heme a synthase
LVKSSWLAKVAFVAAIFAFAVIALGAFTRLVDAGLGCPDWPGCYGHLTVPITGTLNVYKAWAEMIHRYVVGCLSMLIMAVVVIVFKKKFRTRGNIILALSLVALLVYQINLGRWTVTWQLLPIIVTQHLLGGFLILSVLWLMYLNNQPMLYTGRAKRSVPPAINSLLFYAMIGLGLLFLQIFLGAWTSTHYASLSCPDFPFCMNHQSLSPQIKEAFKVFSPIGVNYEGGVLSQAARQTIQMAHRLGAALLTVYFLAFVGVAMLKLINTPQLLRPLFVFLGLFSLQICIGISNVIFKLPLISAMSHTLIAVLLLLTLITFIFKLVRARNT